MCMNKAISEGPYANGTPTIAKIEPYPTSSSDNSRTSYEDNETIAFGPIKVKPRKKPAPTLATGRRSKYEVLSPEEEHKRNVRRARNRAAAERVRISRLTVEQQLQNEIMALEQQEAKLSHDVQTLQHQKLHLETRLFTHERICSSGISSNQPSLTSNIDPTTYFPSTLPQFDTTLSDKMAEADFASFFDSLTDEQIQQNFPESISLIAFDDLNDLLMD